MYKTMLAATIAVVALAPAMADGLAPPPTEVYTAPIVQTCNPTILQVYFQNGEAVLSQQARASIETTADILSGCALASVSMVSRSSDGRDADEAATIASNRIDMVLSALSDQGLTADQTVTRIDAVTDQIALNRPMARRVEVTLAAYRPQIG